MTKRERLERLKGSILKVWIGKEWFFEGELFLVNDEEIHLLEIETKGTILEISHFIQIDEVVVITQLVNK